MRTLSTTPWRRSSTTATASAASTERSTPTTCPWASLSTGRSATSACSCMLTTSSTTSSRFSTRNTNCSAMLTTLNVSLGGVPQGLDSDAHIAEQLVFLVENLDDVVLDVVSIQEHALVADLPVEREAHGQVVGVLLSVDAALAVAVVLLLLHGVVLGVLMTVSDGHGQSDLHALGLALRQQHPVGDPAGAGVGGLVEGRTCGHSRVGVVHQLAEAGDVRDCDRRLARLPHEGVLARGKLMPEFVHFNTVPAAFLEGENDSVVVATRAQEHSDNCVSVSAVVVGDVKAVGEVLVVESRNTRNHINLFHCLAGVYSHLEIEIEVLKECLELSFDMNVVQVNTRELNFFLSVGRERVFVFFEDTIHVLVQSEESWVTCGSLEVLHDTRWQVELSFGVRLASQKDVSSIMQGAIVLDIRAVERRLDNISQMVNTSIVHDVNVGSVSCSDVSMCDSIPDT